MFSKQQFHVYNYLLLPPFRSVNKNEQICNSDKLLEKTIQS